MGRAQREPLRAVRAGERAALERLVRASSERVDRVRRARALGAVAEGAGFAAAARAAGFASPTSVADLVRRFNRRGGAAPGIAPGRGPAPARGRAARGRGGGG